MGETSKILWAVITLISVIIGITYIAIGYLAVSDAIILSQILGGIVNVIIGLATLGLAWLMNH